MARRWTALALAVALVAAAPAYAAGKETLTSNWADVNVCSSSQLGVRAQLAGDGSSTRMQVRFTAQWLSPDGWLPLAGQPMSPWLDAGSAAFTWNQAGWNFNLTIPATGETYQLRAVAEMKLGSGGAAGYTTGTCSVGG
jgi:hypothetical protein